MEADAALAAVAEAGVDAAFAAGGATDLVEPVFEVE